MKKNKSVIKVKNISKSFSIKKEKKDTIKSYFLNPFHKVEEKKFQALKDVSFEIGKGEFVGLIGRNGSGKTTLLRLISGIYEPDEGNIEVNGRLTPFLELGVGFCPELSARDNIFLNGVILGMSKKILESKFDEIVEFAGVEEFIDTQLKNYSSGMQVRLAFSIAMQTNADIYLLDEVLAVGDIEFQKKCLDVVNKMKDGGKTILFVSHKMEDIEKHCSRTLVVNEGRLVFDGDTRKAISLYREVSKKSVK